MNLIKSIIEYKSTKQDEKTVQISMDCMSKPITMTVFKRDLNSFINDISFVFPKAFIEVI